MFNNNKRKHGLLASSVAAALAGLLSGQTTAQEGPELEEVTITGSRIVRRDYEANSPIQTIDSESFEETSAFAVEYTLNQMPQFVPAATQFTNIADGELINTGATLTAGAATLSLRGLAPNRNLVLIDGRRATPVNATMAVDMNSIPAAAIQRVEVITGGASSVYGADAVAGVVNFILKKDFEGATISGRYGAMQNGEAPESQLSALFGANFADGRGNVMMGFEYAKRNAVNREETDFYLEGLLDPTVPGTQSFTSADNYQIAANNRPSGAAIDAIFSQAPANTVLRSATGVIGGNVRWNEDAGQFNLFTGAAGFGNCSPVGAGCTAGRYRYSGPLELDGFPYRKIDAQGEIEENIIGHKANVPLERHSMFARANYEVADGLNVFVQTTNVQARVRQLWQWSPAVGGWHAPIPHGNGVYAPSLEADGVTTRTSYLPGGAFGLSCAATGGCSKSQAFPTPPELNSLLNSRVDPEATWQMNHFFDYALYDKGAPRLIDTETDTWQLQLGIEGELPAIDGSWDIVGASGKSTTILNLQGYAALERYRAVVTAPNYGKGFNRQGNPIGNGFSGGIAQCTTGLPIFRPHDQVSDDCLRAFMVDLQNNAQMRQDYVEANIQGHLIDLPAGEARFAGGYQWRRNNYFYKFDTLTTQNSFLDLSLGTFPADNTQGGMSVEEVYGEVLLPVIAGVTGIQHLNLELGYRYSDYELQGGIDTYKALVDWGITDGLRFRGGYQLATRAPNIAEMFQARSQTWGVNVGDPCGLNSVLAIGANPAANPDAARTRALCSTLMGLEGQENFYDPGNVQPSGSSATWFVNAIGNPAVNPEEATTLTAGIVYQPQTGNALLDGFSSTIDWYSIEIKDMIAVEGGISVYLECLGKGTNPTASPTHPACARITRNPTSGGMQAVDVSYNNTGFTEINGIDLGFNWNGDMGTIGLDSLPGTLSLTSMFNVTTKFETQASVASPVYDWKGSLGPGPETSLNQGTFDWRFFGSLGYNLDNWNFSLRWRHLPEAKAAQAVIAGANGSPFQGAEESYDIFDFSASWALNDTYLFRAGIDNLFDTDAVITGRQDSFGGNRPTSGAGTTLPGFYDPLGRRLYVGLTANF
jgi:outer membrane receptor protein involved in Fe transport